MAYLLYLLVLGFSIFQMFSGNFLFGLILIIISSIIIFLYNFNEEQNMLIEEKNKEEERIQNMSADERIQYEKQKQKERLDRIIDYTIIVAEDSKKSLGSAVTRGAVGGALLGPVGLVGGAISAKNKSETTFTVVYKSGRREVVTVSNDSFEFEKYAKYVR